MNTLTIYFALYAFSMIYLLLRKKTFEDITGIHVTDTQYLIVSVVGSFILAGIIQMLSDIAVLLHNGWRQIRMLAILIFAKLILWHIKRKYKIKP